MSAFTSVLVAKLVAVNGALFSVGNHQEFVVTLWQAMVRAVHVESGAAVFVRGRAADDGYHRATLTMADITTQVYLCLRD